MFFASYHLLKEIKKRKEKKEGETIKMLYRKVNTLLNMITSIYKTLL